jgi:hypothetical protein
MREINKQSRQKAVKAKQQSLESGVWSPESRVRKYAVTKLHLIQDAGYKIIFLIFDLIIM